MIKKINVRNTEEFFAYKIECKWSKTIPCDEILLITVFASSTLLAASPFATEILYIWQLFETIYHSNPH